MPSTKQNYIGLGIEYEVHLPAYFALLLNNKPEIENFILRYNVPGFGYYLDDLFVDIKTKSGENLYFAFQLKHKENYLKNLLPTNFEAKGDFNLEKYCEAFKKLSEENRKYHFILYTNKKFNSSRTNEVKKFDMRQEECCVGRNFFDTSSDGKHLYKFEANEETEDGKNVNKDDYREFFSKFSLYTTQANIRDLEKSILDILKYKECYATYIDFFRKCHRGDYINKIIDKKTLNVHLVDILLSPVAINYYLSDGFDENSNFFEEIVQQFDITVIDASTQDFIKLLEINVHKYPEEFNSKKNIIQLAQDYKFIDRFSNELNEETKLKLLHYFFQKPLILHFDINSKNLINEASKLCRIQENKIKLVFLGRDIDESKFSHLKILVNLMGLNGEDLEETKKRCKLSLQGRNISFEKIFEDEIREFVTPRKLFQMLKGSFSIGEDKEKLPEFYIPRTVSTTVFDIESVIKHSSGSVAIIFYYEEKFEELQMLIQNIVNREDYLYENFLDGIILRKKEPSKKKLHQDKSRDTVPEIPSIILTREESSRKQLDEIREKSGKDDIHLFKVVDEKGCLLLINTTKNISYFENYKSTKTSVEENKIDVFFNNSINIICAQPGMGKSTLMKYLKNEYDPNFWTVMVDLKSHHQFLKRKQKIEDILKYFLELENCQDLFLLNVKRMFLRKKKIVFFLDGLDEIENECVDYVLNITRQLSEMGFRIWLSSRQNFQQEIQQYFKIFAIEINELNEDQQKKYMENKLASLYNQNEIEEIVEKIFSNTNLVNNCQILKIPLQLHIITQFFFENNAYFFNLSKNNFNLTKMFEIFFEGKYRHYLEKLGVEYPHLLGGFEEKFEQYEIVALHSVLDDEHFQKLKIEKLIPTHIKNLDYLGIITEINNENKAVFENSTFAEYFASKFLFKNSYKARLLKEEIGAEKYRNLRLIFNTMMEEVPKRRTTENPDLGMDCEVLLPAYFALLLNTNPEIEDFKLQSNVQDFENLDDLLVDIKTRSGKNLYFAFQLKHKEDSKNNLLPANFEAKGDFNLEKYCEAFKNLSEESRRKYHFILYTNKNFDPSRTNEVKKFDMREDECCLGRFFFDTSGDVKHLYKFEVNGKTRDGKNVKREDFGDFFSKFCLYTGQASIRNLEKSILHILKYKKCYVTYMDFFRKWHRGDFVDIILDKKTLNIHLVDIFLSSFVLTHHLSDGQDKRSNFFETMVQQFDITIIDGTKKEFINQLEENVLIYPEKFSKNLEEIIKLGKKSKLIDRFTNELNEETKVKFLHYFFKKPLILDFHECSDVIYEVSKLCRIQENGIKLVILGRDIDASKFSHLKIFTKLSEVDGILLEQTKRRCSLSLQGRNISFGEIFDDKMSEFVTPKEIFQMLKGNFSIGKDKENLPQYYIPRTVSATVFDIESIIKHSSASVAIVFYYEDRFEELKILIQIILDPKDYSYEYLLDTIMVKTRKRLNNDKTTIILIRKRYSRSQLDNIREKTGKDDVHLFQVLDGKTCLLLMSTKNISSFKENYKSRKMSVDEYYIHVFFNNPINILCAQPGMGKSTLMKYLKNQCDSNFWTVMVDLKAHTDFLKRNSTIEDIVNYFLELESCHDLFLLNIKRMFLKKRKIVLFLDGLDEVEHKCVDRVLELSKLLGEMGFRIWLSSRQNLQQKLEQYFNTFAIEINELNEYQQKNYIEDRLTSQYNKNQIEEIVDKIFSNTNVANNCQILEIPLQLHIITQIFLDERSYYNNLKEDSFIVTKMFETFFEGKYKHFLTKIGLDNDAKENYIRFLGRVLEEQLEKYEIVALHCVLDDEHFQKLQIEKPKLTQTKDWDFLGIITEINSDNKAVFEHLTFAEYFASKFLVKNSDKARILREEIFTEKYRNLFLIFNIMLAEDSPLHLAIIFKDLSRIEELGQSSWVNKGGRTFIQVATCVATRHPLLESTSSPLSECLVKDLPVQHFKGENSTMKEIVNLVLSSGEPFKKDEIFEWNSLNYALVTGALYIVEAILDKFEKPPNFYEMIEKYYRDEVIVYYSIRFGYHHLLSEILAKKSCHVPAIVSDNLNGEENNSILHFLFLNSKLTNRTRIVELLIDDDVNKTVYDKKGYTFLHFAVYHEDIQFLKWLLQKRANLNVKDKDGLSPLLWTVKRNNLEMSKLLLMHGAEVNIKDKDLKSPLFWAVEQRNLDISKLLIEEGADVNVKDENEKSPLSLAVEQYDPEMSKLLFESGAEVNIEIRQAFSSLLQGK